MGRLLARRGVIIAPGSISSRLWIAMRGFVARWGHRRRNPEYFTLGTSTGRYYPVDFEPGWIDTIERVTPFTLTTPERLAALCSATEYVVREGIPGSFVECGVWRGGSMMAVALTLERLGVEDRDLYLFDTFRGMTRPTEADVDFAGVAYLDHWPIPEDGFDAVPLREVEAALATTGYDPAHLHFVQGSVEETLPDHAPSQLALLRLDTDWYESTRHELIHLYPRLALGGVVIIDDYGHLEGARKATDEYFDGHRILLHRIDYTARIGIKQQHAGSSANTATS
jgi:O-methyltransferase